MLVTHRRWPHLTSCGLPSFSFCAPVNTPMPVPHPIPSVWQMSNCGKAPLDYTRCRPTRNSSNKPHLLPLPSQRRKMVHATNALVTAAPPKHPPARSGVWCDGFCTSAPSTPPPPPISVAAAPTSSHYPPPPSPTSSVKPASPHPILLSLSLKSRPKPYHWALPPRSSAP